MRNLNIQELKIYASANPIDWTVDGLLKESSFNIIAGGPKSGKSSLARQLAVAVSKGELFLDFAVKRGDVLYICPDEPDTSELHRSFHLLGAADRLYVSPFPVNRSSLITDLRDALEEHPDISLIILDTLEKTVELEDLNDYSKALRDLGPLVTFAAENKITIVGLHHTNKRTATSVSGALMGSNGIGSVSTTSLEVMVDHDEKRYLRSMQRYGRPIEKTELHYNSHKQFATMGKSESQRKSERSVTGIKDKERKLMDVIFAHPGIGLKGIMEKVPGSSQDTIRQLKDLETKGIIRLDGKGRRGSPHSYHPAEMPTEAVPAAA